MRNKVAAAITLAILYVIEPIEQVWLMVPVYIGILAFYSWMDRSRRKINRQRRKSRRFDYELYEIQEDGSLEPVEGSRQ